MSFTFNWPRFSDQFHYDAIQMLNTALNKGNKPPIIADKIEVVELEMGTQPPELEIRDIGDLTVDQFRGIFRLTYAGDAHLVLKTKVQANPLNHKQPDIHLMGGSRGMLAAKHPLVVPMLLRLSHFRLSSYVVLVVSKQKGITLVFKTDPLQNVDINSTFDSIAVIQNFIQREIEGQLRQMFREDLPGIIHRLSQQWVKSKVETPYLNKRPPPVTSTPPTSAHRSFDTFPIPAIGSDAGVRPRLTKQPSQTSFGSRRTRPTSASGTSVAGSSRSHQRFAPQTPSPLSPSNAESYTPSHPDLENFDPTYGLRPEGLPTKSVFRGFSSMFTPNKGLADLAEESEASSSDIGEDEYDEEYDEEGDSFDFVDWTQDERHPGLHTQNNSPGSSSGHNYTEQPEYETIPAVGGGTVTRPRIYHSQSSIQTTPSMSKSLGALPTRSYSQTMLTMGMGLPPHMPLHMHAHPRSGATTPLMSPYFAEYSSNSVAGPGSSRRLPHSSLGRSSTPDSSESPPSRSSSGPSTRRTVSTDLTEHTSTYTEPLSATATSPIYMRRRMSVTSNTTTTSTANGNANLHSNEHPNGHMRSPSASSTSFLSISPTSSYMHMHTSHHDPAAIVLRPSLNNDSIHQLSTLSHSNHTLSPYTRDLSHFTVRSVPPRPRGAGPGGSGWSSQQGQLEKPRAKRKRTYRLGGSKPAGASLPTTANGNAPAASGVGYFDPPVDRFASSSPTPPSEFDVSDMDRYFPPSVPSTRSTAVMADDGSKTVRPRVRPAVSANLAPMSNQYSSETGARHRPAAKSIF